MKNLIFQLLLITTVVSFVSCKSSKNTTTENKEMTQAILTENHWKLVELSGVLLNETTREPFIIFENEQNRVHGNTSCNNFFGTFELKGKNQIRFSQVGMTKMACIGNDVETRFIQVLDSTMTCKIYNGVLLFFDKKGSVLARFEGETPK